MTAEEFTDMVFNKIDINGDGEDLPWAVPLLLPSPLPALQAARAIPAAGCPKTAGQGELAEGGSL